jgi:hypothetical protein
MTLDSVIGVTGATQPEIGYVGAAFRPTPAQRAWLKRGLNQPGGKLPLFDANGKRMNSAIVAACLNSGWAEPWFANPLKPDWLVCKLTIAGRRIAAA